MTANATIELIKLNHVKDDKISNQVLTQADILAQISSLISQTHAVLQIEPGQCQLLLVKFNWDFEAIKETFHAYQKDTNQLLIENNLMPKVTVVPSSLDCGVCCSDESVLSSPCGHSACESCWKSYFKEKIENRQVLIECMDPNCTLLVSPGSILPGSELLGSYQKLVIMSFVEAIPDITWCNKNCGNALKRRSSDSQTVTCSCGSTFCFSCGAEPHLPATCRHLELWQRKFSTMSLQLSGDYSDQKSLEWMLTNTKDCPKCLTPIQKIGGCQHVTCVNTKCRYSFCWMCHERWFTHGLGCNRSKRDAIKSRLNTHVSSSLFLCYVHLIEKQKKNMELEQDAITKCHPKTMNIKDLQNSAKVLLESRKTLMNSYIFGYFLRRGGSYFNKFENSRKKLEKEVSRLSDVLKKCCGSDVQMLALNKTAAKCQSLQKFLLFLCSEGKIHEDLEGASHAESLTSDQGALPIWGEGFIIFFSITTAIVLALLLLGFGYILEYSFSNSRVIEVTDII